MKSHILDRTAMLVALVQLSGLLCVCTACSVPEGWQHLPVTTRAASDTVYFAVLGNVTRTTVLRFVRRFGGTVYGAEVAVECVYKTPPQQNIYGAVDVIGFGESNDCITTDVDVHEQYIFLMAPYQTGFAVVESNVEVAAEPATLENVQAMFDQFGCEPPSDPTTPPPTTTPLITTTRPPTTEPPTTSIASTTEAMKEPDEQDPDVDDRNSATVASLSCLAIVALISSWALIS